MKTQNPLIGRAKGSAGGMTACKMYDKNVLKAKAFEVSDPKTAAQENQRNFFKEVSDLVSQLSEEQIRFLCPKAPKSMSRRNFITKQIASHVTTSSGQKVVDLANIKTLGNGKEVKYFKPAVDVETDEISVYNNESWPSFEYTKSHQLFALLIRVDEKTLELKASADLLINDDVVTFDKNGATPTSNLYAILFSAKTTTPLTTFGTMVPIERPAR